MPYTKHRVRFVQRNRTLKRCYIFSCDDTCNLDVVEKLLSGVNEKLGIKMLVFKNHFNLSGSSEMCENVIPDLLMDFAVCVVHANKNLNDDISSIYKALLKATGDRTICVITGDINYKTSTEEQSTVLSQWAKRKVSSQFSEEYLDGRKSFIFSWDKKHRPVHEEALLHYFDPHKKEGKFVPEPKLEVTPVSREDPKQVQLGRRYPDNEKEEDEDIKESAEPFEGLTRADVPGIQRSRLPVNNKMEEPKPSSIAYIENPDEGETEESIKCVYLFNCDKTYNLNAVEKLFKDINPTLKTKLKLALSIQWHYFALMKMSTVSENIIPKLKMDVAVFVVHAHESRLSINEDDAGIGYAKIYRALLQATGEKVIIVIGGDDNYKNSIEEQGTVLSQWARRKVSSQFSEEYLDGRKSFIFSWDKEHRPIHEEALLHYFDSQKKEERFVPELKVKVTVSREDPEKVEEFPKNRETGVKRSKTETNSSHTQAETEAPKGKKECKQASAGHPPQTEEKAIEKEQEMDGFELLTSEEITDDALPKPEPENVQSPSYKPNIAFLYRNQSDMANIKDLFGDDVSGMNAVTSNDPHDMEELLLSLNPSVRSFFIMVESINMKEELLTKSSSTLYQDLLKTASRTVAKKIVVILCNKGDNISPGEEKQITASIEKLIGEKGIIAWWKGNTETTRSIFSQSLSHPAPKSEEHPINPTDFTLVCKTRLRRGKISKEKKDVEVWSKEWIAPQKMIDELSKEWHSTNIAKLSVYRENKTGHDHTIVTKDWETRVSGVGKSIEGALEYVGTKFADYTDAGARAKTSVIGAGASATGAGVTLLTDFVEASIDSVSGRESMESTDIPPDGRSDTSAENNDSDRPCD